MTTRSTDSTPLRERLLPQTSIRFFMLLISACAVVMYIFRAAMIDGVFWAKIVALLIQTAGVCFAAYTLLFLIANLFYATTSPIVDAIENRNQKSNDQSQEADDPEGVQFGHRDSMGESQSPETSTGGQA